MFSTASVFCAIGILVLFSGIIGLLLFLRKAEFETPASKLKGAKKFRLNFGLILLSALLFGVIFGYILKLIWNSGLVDVAVAVNYSLEWIDILQSVFLSALELLIVPLVLVSIIRSLLKAGSGADASKSAATILAVLLGTCALAALTGYCVVRLFGIGAADFTFARPTALTPTSIIRTVKSIVPSNLFNAIGRNSVLPVVFLAAIFGAAALTVKKTIPAYGSKLEVAVEIAYKLIGTVVDFVVDFTPFGILSLVTVNIATNDWTLLVSLGKFIVAFYAGAVIVAAIHICILLIFGVKVTEYFKKSSNAFLFALSTLSSVATMPLTIKSQMNMGVKDGTANLAASLGTCIGQNACAGLYPAMLATIIALMTPGQQDVWTLSFAVQLILFTVVGSVGAAGVGGGNIQASLMVVSMMGMDFSLITLFLAVDFIVSLPRPPLNVSDSILSGVVTQKLEDRRNSKAAQKLKAA